MQRWQAATLAVMMFGCLEPLTDDQPGYSRHILPPGSEIASAYDDVQLNRKIDLNDGLSGNIPIKTGFAAGSEVRYWDLGPAKRSASPAYLLTRCADGSPLANGAVDHPIVVETIPGDSDYSPYRALNWTCVTDRYNGELFTSLDAINDGIDLGLLNEPIAAERWLNLPIVGQDVGLSLGRTVRPAATAYYRGTRVLYHNFVDQEGDFPNPTTLPQPGYVYEISRLGYAYVIDKVIFSQPYTTDGVRNPRYSPQWTLVTVTLRSVSVAIPDDEAQQMMDIQSWTREEDIVTFNSAGYPLPKPGTRVLAVSVTQTRVNRPFALHTEVP